MSVTTEVSPPPPVSPEPLGVASFQHVLKNRHFLLLWLAQLISLTVFNAANFGLVVLVNEVSKSVIMVYLAIISFTLPALPFSAVAGVLVDRMDKRRVLWMSNVLRMVFMLCFVISLLFDRPNLWPLLGLSYLTALVGQFFAPAEGAAIPLLVGERELMPALSLFNITMTLSMAIGFLLLGRVGVTIFPAFTLVVGALVLHVRSIDMLFFVVACAYLLCAGLIFAITPRAFHEKHVQKRIKHVGAETEKLLASLWRDLVAGWRVVRVDRLLFFSVIQLSVVGIIMLMIGELAGPFVVQIMQRPPEDMAIILAPAGIGLVGASILMPRLIGRIERVRLTVIGFVTLALGFVALPGLAWFALRLDPVHGTQSALAFWVTVVLTLLLGTALACINIPTQTIMQERAPKDARARVFSLQFMLYNLGSLPVLLFAALIAQYVGLKEFIVVASVGMLLFCWWGARYARKG